MAYIIQIIVQPFFRLAYNIAYRLEIRGQENTKDLQKPLLVISNHRSVNDPWIIGSSLPMFSHLMPGHYIGGTRFDQPLKFFYDIGVISFIYWIFGSAEIPRDGTMEEKIQPIINFIKKGGMVILFPEGGRSRGPGGIGIGPFKHGAAEIFVRTGAPILPAAIVPSTKKKGKLIIVFGKAITPQTQNVEEITVLLHS